MRRIVLILLLAAYALFSFQHVSFSGTANDLARHLRDGELILGGMAGAILHHNYYSYAHPQAVFVNHHWLMSVLFYLVYKTAGLEVLNVLYVVLGLVTFYLYFRIAEREAGLPMAGAVAALLMPLLALRPGIRPEVFSILLLGIFFAILWGNQRRWLSPRWLWILPLLEILWANLHPGFAMGPILLGAFLVVEIALRQVDKQLAIVSTLTFFAGLLNPNGLEGWIFPVAVTNNYAMPVRENLSPFALQEVWMATVVEVAVALLAAAWIWVWKKKARMEWPLLLFSLALAGMTLVFFRVYIFLGWFVLVSVCVAVRAVGETRKIKAKKQATRTPTWLWAGMLAVAAVNGAAVLIPRGSDIGLGLTPHDGDLAQFMSANGISGKVFNSFPSGGYLIHYFPGQQVYIDNRPEAYPGEFIRDEYLRPLEDEDAWHRTVQKYDFDYICFVRFNQDESKFLLRRVRDREWATLYAGTQMVLLRRSPKFADVIARHEIKF